MSLTDFSFHHFRFMTLDDAFYEMIVRAGRGYEPFEKSFIAHDLLLTINKPTFRVELKDVGYREARWKKYINEYFGGTEPRLSSLVKQKTFQSGKAEAYIPCGGGNHRWGPCLIGVTISPKRVALHSRSVSWCPTGVLDLKLAAMLAQEIEGSVSWHISQLQFFPFKCIPFIYTKMPELWKDIKKGKSPFVRNCQDFLKRMETTGFHQHQSTIRRIDRMIGSRKVLLMNTRYRTR